MDRVLITIEISTSPSTVPRFFRCEIFGQNQERHILSFAKPECQNSTRICVSPSKKKTIRWSMIILKQYIESSDRSISLETRFTIKILVPNQMLFEKRRKSSWIMYFDHWILLNKTQIYSNWSSVQHNHRSKIFIALRFVTTNHTWRIVSNWNLALPNCKKAAINHRSVGPGSQFDINHISIELERSDHRLCWRMDWRKIN